MLYRTMPKTGDRLSILGFGCMRLPVTDGKIDEKRAISQIRHAVDNGVNYIDTAWPYHNGESEILLGRALKDGYRDKVKVATKLPSWMIKTRGDMDRYLAAQMKKIGTDHIDYYLLHALNGIAWDALDALGVIDFLDRAKEDGRIASAGFSFHGTADDFKRIVDAYPSWIFCQIQYNFLDQENQAGTDGLKHAAAKNLGVIVMEPLRGGNLGLAAPPPAVREIWNEAATRRTPVEWALRWVWNHPEVTVVLSGMNEEAHIAENLAVADTAHADALTEAELALVERACRKYRELMKVDCTGCGYCMPCPSGVAIPTCFEIYNKMHMFGNTEEAKISYATRTGGDLTGGETGYASQCIECGECLDKCPQRIKIPEILPDVAAALEGPGLEERLAVIRQRLRAEPK